jgi:hypothetical protein
MNVVEIPQLSRRAPRSSSRAKLLALVAAVFVASGFIALAAWLYQDTREPSPMESAEISSRCLYHWKRNLVECAIYRLTGRVGVADRPLGE